MTSFPFIVLLSKTSSLNRSQSICSSMFVISQVSLQIYYYKLRFLNFESHVSQTITQGNVYLTNPSRTILYNSFNEPNLRGPYHFSTTSFVTLLIQYNGIYRQRYFQSIKTEVTGCHIYPYTKRCNEFSWDIVKHNNKLSSHGHIKQKGSNCKVILKFRGKYNHSVTPIKHLVSPAKC